MASLSPSQVAHIALLARLMTLNDSEAESMAKELGAILSYVDILNEVNTDNVAPTAQVTGLSTVLRDDTVTTSDASPESLLATSPLPVIDRQIRTPHAHS